MIKKSLVLIPLLLTVLRLPAQDLALPDPPPRGPLPYRFALSTFNDGYMGFGASDEYDDLRSYGINAELFVPGRYWANLQLAGITQRGAPPGEKRAGARWTDSMPEPSRIDRIGLWGGVVAAEADAGPGRLLLAVTGGAALDGRFGGMEIQGLIHETGGVNRPFPERYRNPSLLAALGLKGEWSAGTLYPLNLSAEFGLNTRFEPRIDLRVRLEDVSRNSRFWCGFQYIATADHASDIQERYLNAFEEGLNLRIGFSGTHVFLFQNINLCSREMLFDGALKSSGGIGFSTASINPGPPRRGVLSAEAGLLTNRGSQTLIFFRPGWYAPLYPPLTGRSGFYGVTGNFNSHPDLNGSPGEWRMQYWSGGFRIALFPTRDDWVPNLFLDAGLCLKWVLTYSIDAWASVPLREELLLTGDFRLGAEQPLPIPVREDRNRYAFQLYGWLQPELAGRCRLADPLPWFGLGFAIVIRDGS